MSVILSRLISETATTLAKMSSRAESRLIWADPAAAEPETEAEEYANFRGLLITGRMENEPKSGIELKAHHQKSLPRY